MRLRLRSATTLGGGAFHHGHGHGGGGRSGGASDRREQLVAADAVEGAEGCGDGRGAVVVREFRVEQGGQQAGVARATRQALQQTRPETATSVERRSMWRLLPCPNCSSRRSAAAIVARQSRFIIATTTTMHATTAIGTSATSAAAAALLKTKKTVPQAVPQVQLDAGAGAALCGDELRARAATSPRGAHPQAVRAREAGTTTTTSTSTSTTSTGRSL